MIKEYFANYFLHSSDVTLDLKNNKIEIHNNVAEPWKVTLVDTGYSTQTGARIKKIEKYIEGEDFMLTYGDGVSDININHLLAHHKTTGKIGTLTAVQPEGRFGVLDISSDSVINRFHEKPKGDGNWINGGYFVFKNEFFKYLSLDEDLVLEKGPLE